MKTEVGKPHFTISGFLDNLTQPIRHMDNLFARISKAFGTSSSNPSKQYGIFIFIYGIIYLVGILPIRFIPLLALCYGYIGILSVGRAWVLNEKERSLIAKNLKVGDPDDMPDLRGLALLSAGQLLIIFPLLFFQLQQHFNLYQVPDGASNWTWLGFTIDSYNKSFIGLFEIYGIEIHHIEYRSIWGRHAMTVIRLTFDFILIQGFLRLLSIRQVVAEKVAALKNNDLSILLLGGRAAVPLIHALKSEDHNVQKHAAALLSKMKTKLPVPHLIDCIPDQSVFVRETAAQLLGLSKDSASVLPLIGMLGDSDLGARGAAAAALGLLRDNRAVEPLIAALKYTYDDDGQARYFVLGHAALSLGTLGDTRAVLPLIDLLIDDEGRICSDVVEALGLLRDLRAVQPLIDIINRAYHLGDYSKQGGNITERHDFEYDEIEIDDIAKSLGMLGDKRAVKAVISAFTAELKEGDILPGAASALGVLGDPEAVEPLIASLNYVKCCPSAMSLGLLGDKRAVEPLMAVLKDENYYLDDRIAAAQALGRLKDPRALGLMLSTLYALEPSLQVVAQAAIGEFVSPTQIDPLLLAIQDVDEGVRLKAAELLLQYGSPAGVPPLIAFLASPYLSFHDHASRLLATYPHSSAVTPLIGLLAHRQSFVRQSSARLLGKFGNKQAIVPLVASLADEFPDVVIASLASIGELGHLHGLDHNSMKSVVTLLENENLSIQAAARTAVDRILSYRHSV